MSEIEQTESAPETTEPDTAEQQATEAPETGVDVDALQADLAKWKSFARKNEAEAKKLREQQMSDTEKAVADAEERGRNAARVEAAQAVAQARLEAALAGIVPADKAAELIGDVNVAAYVTEDGDVDAEKVAAFRARYESLVPAKPAAPDLAQGVRRKDKPGQLSRSDLQNMTPEAILAAKADGRFDDLLGMSTN